MPVFFLYKSSKFSERSFDLRICSLFFIKNVLTIFVVKASVSNKSSVLARNNYWKKTGDDTQIRRDYQNREIK